MLIRSPEKLLKDWQAATNDNPLCLQSGESDNFSKAMRLSWPKEERKKFTIDIMDRDKLLKDNIQSPADGKRYSSRKDWNEMLKRNNCVEFGNDAKAAPRPIQMKNMNLKPAIAEAIKRHT